MRCTQHPEWFAALPTRSEPQRYCRPMQNGNEKAWPDDSAVTEDQASNFAAAALLGISDPMPDDDLVGNVSMCALKALNSTDLGACSMALLQGAAIEANEMAEAELYAPTMPPSTPAADEPTRASLHSIANRLVLQLQHAPRDPMASQQRALRSGLRIEVLWSLDDGRRLWFRGTVVPNGGRPSGSGHWVRKDGGETWAAEEDRALLAAIRAHELATRGDPSQPIKWKYIADQVLPGRSRHSCRNRYRRLIGRYDGDDDDDEQSRPEWNVAYDDGHRHALRKGQVWRKCIGGHVANDDAAHSEDSLDFVMADDGSEDDQIAAAASTVSKAEDCFKEVSMSVLEAEHQAARAEERAAERAAQVVKAAEARRGEMLPLTTYLSRPFEAFKPPNQLLKRRLSTGPGDHDDAFDESENDADDEDDELVSDLDSDSEPDAPSAHREVASARDGTLPPEWPPRRAGECSHNAWCLKGTGHAGWCREARPMIIKRPEKLVSLWPYSKDAATMSQPLDDGGGDEAIGADDRPAEKNKVRMTFCGECQSCKRPDCGRCKECRDQKRFGGPGVKKQRCKHRKCLTPVEVQLTKRMRPEDRPSETEKQAAALERAAVRERMVAERRAHDVATLAAAEQNALAAMRAANGLPVPKPKATVACSKCGFHVSLEPSAMAMHLSVCYGPRSGLSSAGASAEAARRAYKPSPAPSYLQPSCAQAPSIVWQPRVELELELELEAPLDCGECPPCLRSANPDTLGESPHCQRCVRKVMFEKARECVPKSDSQCVLEESTQRLWASMPNGSEPLPPWIKRCGVCASCTSPDCGECRCCVDRKLRPAHGLRPCERRMGCDERTRTVANTPSAAQPQLSRAVAPASSPPGAAAGYQMQPVPFNRPARLFFAEGVPKPGLGAGPQASETIVFDVRLPEGSQARDLLSVKMRECASSGVPAGAEAKVLVPPQARPGAVLTCQAARKNLVMKPVGSGHAAPTPMGPPLPKPPPPAPPPQTPPPPSAPPRTTPPSSTSPSAPSAPSLRIAPPADLLPIPSNEVEAGWAIRDDQALLAAIQADRKKKTTTVTYGGEPAKTAAADQPAPKTSGVTIVTYGGQLAKKAAADQPPAARGQPGTFHVSPRPHATKQPMAALPEGSRDTASQMASRFHIGATPFGPAKGPTFKLAPPPPLAAPNLGDMTGQTAARWPQGVPVGARPMAPSPSLAPRPPVPAQAAASPPAKDVSLTPSQLGQAAPSPMPPQLSTPAAQAITAVLPPGIAAALIHQQASEQRLQAAVSALHAQGQQQWQQQQMVQTSAALGAAAASSASELPPPKPGRPPGLSVEAIRARERVAAAKAAVAERAKQAADEAANARSAGSLAPKGTQSKTSRAAASPAKDGMTKEAKTAEEVGSLIEDVRRVEAMQVSSTIVHPVGSSEARISGHGSSLDPTGSVASPSLAATVTVPAASPLDATSALLSNETRIE